MPPQHEHKAWAVPERLADTCCTMPEGTAWLEQLPDALRDLAQRWTLTLGKPFDGEQMSCAWVAPATRADGTTAVLKLAIPHTEGAHELHGLRFWDGDPTVRLLEADEDLGAMLLERCEPGTALRTLPEPEQDLVIARLLRRLWRPPPMPHPFRPLSAMTAYWSDETRADAERWPDAGLVQEGLRLFEELPHSAPTEVLLATDLHAGNVLRAQRAPWLVIDPKPFVGNLRMTRRSTCSIVWDGYARTRTERFAASRTCWVWIPSGFACGRSPAPQRSRARSGSMTTWWNSHGLSPRSDQRRWICLWPAVLQTPPSSSLQSRLAQVSGDVIEVVS